MKKNTLLLIVSLTLFSSCASTGTLKYFPLDNQMDIQIKDIQLANVQVDMSNASWSVQSGNVITTYYYKLDNGNFVGEALQQKLGIKLNPFTMPSDSRVEWFAQMQSKGIQPSKSHYGIANGLIVTDQEPDQMESSTLDILKSSSDSKYFLVIDFDFPKMSTGRWYNLYNFRILGEMAVILYDRTGKKVLSKHFFKEFTYIKTKISEIETFTNIIDVLIWENKEFLFKYLGSPEKLPENQIGRSI